MIKVIFKYSILLLFIFLITLTGIFQLYSMYLGGKYPQELSLDINGTLNIKASKTIEYGIEKTIKKICNNKDKYFKTDIPYTNIEHIVNSSKYKMFFNKKMLLKKVNIEYLSKSDTNICIWKHTNGIVKKLSSNSFFSVEKSYLNFLGENINKKYFHLKNDKKITIISTLDNKFIFKIMSREELIEDTLFYQDIKIAKIYFQGIKK